MLIGILSDTHGLLRKEVIDEIQERLEHERRQRKKLAEQLIER